MIDHITASPAIDIVQKYGLSESSLQGDRSFLEILKNDISELNSQINSSEAELRSFALGETDNLHHLMLTMEKSKLQFELFMQVRNKVIDGYKEILRMQV